MRNLNKDIEKMEKLINNKFQPKGPVKSLYPFEDTTAVDMLVEEDIREQEENHRLEREKIEREMEAMKRNIEREFRQMKVSPPISGEMHNWIQPKRPVVPAPPYNHIPTGLSLNRDKIPKSPYDVDLNKENDVFVLSWNIRANWGVVRMSESLPSTFIPTDDNIRKLLSKITDWYDDLIKGVKLESLMMEDVL